MKFILSSLYLIPIVTKNYWTVKLFMLKILLMQTKLRFHTIEYFCFYLNNQLLLFTDHETSHLHN